MTNRELLEADAIDMGLSPAEAKDVVTNFERSGAGRKAFLESETTPHVQIALAIVGKLPPATVIALGKMIIERKNKSN
jgi:hypothetical protein